MYGTVAHMKVKPGKLADLVSWNDNFNRDRNPKGYIGEYVYQLDHDPNEVMLVVLFQDKASYMANAQDPGQDKEYQKMRALLEADPHWHDGEVVHSFLKK
ncbi:MAG: hypothetical protein WEB04_07155 [Dehalococcoidia bacterium]